jgi:hypothetical protein
LFLFSGFTSGLISYFAAYRGIERREDKKRMDIKRLLADLKGERQRVDQAIAALEALDGTGARTRFAGKRAPAPTSATTTPKRRRRRMSAAGRKRISEMMKARWAARRKAAKKG